MINESNLLNIVFVYAILHAIMGSGPQIRVADNERMIDPKALFFPKLNYSRQQHNRDWRATTFYPRLPPKIQFWAKKRYITKNCESEKKRYFFIAGAVCVLQVFVEGFLSCKLL